MACHVLAKSFEYHMACHVLARSFEYSDWPSRNVASNWSIAILSGGREDELKVKVTFLGVLMGGLFSEH